MNLYATTITARWKCSRTVWIMTKKKIVTWAECLVTMIVMVVKFNRKMSFGKRRNQKVYSILMMGIFNNKDQSSKKKLNSNNLQQLQNIMKHNTMTVVQRKQIKTSIKRADYSAII